MLPHPFSSSRPRLHKETAIRGRVASSASRGVILAVVVGLGAFFRFHGLHWSDAGWPHPDERAVISQTYDLLAADSYRPQIHTWGHFAYYSALFVYKAYLHLQHRINTGEWWLSVVHQQGERLAPTTGGAPNIRELSDVTLMTFALFVLAIVSIATIVSARLDRRRLLLIGLIGMPALLLAALAWPAVHRAMLTPVAPNFEDVALTGRAIAAFVSTASILLVYGIAATLYSPKVGLLAAAFFAVTVRAAQLAHFFAVEPLQTFGVLLALLMASRLWSLQSNAARASTWKTIAQFTLMGAAIGLAMASKFSAAPLFALPFVLHLLLLHARSGVRAIVLHVALVLACVAALGGWFALHPYAWENAYEPFASAQHRPMLGDRWLHILFSRDFADQIAEQGRMVAGEGGPWVQQFADTTPFLSMAGEMVRWSFGWPLGLVAVAGLVYVCARNVRCPRAEDLILLSFAAPTLLILGTFKATFPRYTLPVLGVICIFAAKLCLDVGNQRRRTAAGLAAIATLGGLMYCAAYMRVYDAPHAWTTASLWIYRNVPIQRPDGQRTAIAHEEWDDEIPLEIGSQTPSSYAHVRMDPYSSDKPDKAARLASQLAAADWIGLPTTRVYSTVLEVADRYPVTAAYYRLLFAGELGFTLRKTVYEAPRLGSWTWFDLTADESHYVYDHPKAAIFEKTSAVPAEELRRRIELASSAIGAPSRLAILSARERPEEQLRNVWRDPYARANVLTADEIAARLATFGAIDQLSIASVLDDLLQHDAVQSVHALDVENGIDASSHVDAATIAQARAVVAQLKSRDAYRAADVSSAVRRRLIDIEPSRRNAIARSLAYDATGSHLARGAVLGGLDKVDLAPSPVQLAPIENAAASVDVGIVEFGGAAWEVWQAVKWLGVLQLLGLAALPLTLWLFESMPDRGFGLARLIGWILTTYIACAVTVLGIGAFTAVAAWAALTVVAVISWIARGADFRRRLPPLRVLLAGESLFAAAFIAFALVRTYNPEIFWGEKTMDFSLLNGVVRAGRLPPYEPWFAGERLNYYYYGYFLAGLLVHLAATPTAVAFNLLLATIPALTLSAAFSIAYWITRSIGWALGGAAAVGLIANFDHVFQIARGEASRPVWDNFWATSRALGPGMINEYPVWSWLFADLHAHVIVMPVSMLCLALVALLFFNRSAGASQGGARSRIAWLLLALTIGTQAATNTWDVLAYAGVLTLALGTAALSSRSAARDVVFPPFRRSHVGAAGDAAITTEPRRKTLAIELTVGLAFVLAWPALCALHPYWLGLVAHPANGLLIAATIVVLSRNDNVVRRFSENIVTMLWHLLRELIAPACIVVALSVLLFGEFYSHLDTAAFSIRPNRDGNIGIEHVMRHFGGFVIATVVWLVLFLAAFVERQHVTTKRWPRAVVALALVELTLLTVLLASGWARAASGLTLYLLLAVPALAVMQLAERVEVRFSALLLASGWGLAAASELIVLTDRMNTVFKLYHPAWTVLAIGSAGCLGAVVLDREPSLSHSRAMRLMRPAALLMTWLVVMVTLWGTARALDGVLTRNLKVSDKPTLNGLDFLRQTPHERELLETIEWLNARASDLPVVAEAFTNRAYDESARITKYTGLPILLGWSHHLVQRGRSVAQVEERRRDLERLYLAASPDEALRVCRKYRIRYVVVGDLEREQYGDAAARFSRMPTLREVFHSSSRAYVIFAPANTLAALTDSR